MRTNKTYTVIVLVPDYVAYNYGDFYIWKVEARSVKKAQKRAQEIAAMFDVPDLHPQDLDAVYKDYRVVAVFEGNLPNIAR